MNAAAETERDVRADADRSHARTAAAVRNAERLVQIQMANIRADVARTAKPDLRVHVRAVHVNLAAVRMHDLANLADRCFEHAVRGWIGDHQRSQIVFVRFRFRAQIGEIDVAIFQTRDRHDFESGHDRARRIRSVGGCRNEADVAMRLAARCVILANGEQSGVFALRSGVRLQRNRGESGDFREPIFQLLAHFAVASRLVVRRERMQLRKFRPRNWKHLGGRVQFHGAGTERNHRSGERKIARFQPPQVAQHFRFGVGAC